MVNTEGLPPEAVETAGLGTEKDPIEEVKEHILFLSDEDRETAIGKSRADEDVVETVYRYDPESGGKTHSFKLVIIRPEIPNEVAVVMEEMGSAADPYVMLFKTQMDAYGALEKKDRLDWEELAQWSARLERAAAKSAG
jgi:hypothetical protein